MMKKMRKMFGTASGFTLLEMLVVLMILGFLLAMVVPRLTDFAGKKTRITVCKSAQKELDKAVTSHLLYEGALPDGLINIVLYDGADYTGPGDAPLDPLVAADMAKPVFAPKFNKNNNFGTYALNKAEVKELTEMGIKTIYNLYEGSGTPVVWEELKEVSLSTTSPNYTYTVLMVGAAGTDAGVVSSNWANPDKVMNPSWQYRIVMGLGDDCTLVTNEYIVDSEGGVKRAVQDGSSKKYTYHNIVLPRLDATRERIAAATGLCNLTAKQGTKERTWNFCKVKQDGSDYEIMATGGIHWSTRDFTKWVIQ